MAWQQLLADLELSRRQLDRQTQQDCLAAGQKQVGIYCKKGCSSCCTLTVNCSFSEALAIAKNLPPAYRQTLNEKIPLLQQISRQANDLRHFLRQFRDQLGGCPFLSGDSGSCTIYALRPLSCRALISTRNSSWCAVDFAGLHPLEKEAFLSSLDPEIVAFPTHYLAAPQELGLELESFALVAMRDTFGVALSGNLLYLVWLELTHQISAILPQGFVATGEFIAAAQLDLPFLLQLQGD